MVSSAAGGGLLTAFTVALKFGIAGAALPIFFDGLASSLNYAGSFLLMQLFGHTLATKQPAMTAAALASAMSSSPQRRGIDAVRLVALIARITRSQLAAIIGNLGMVVPAALALDAVSRLVSGHPFLDAEAAHHVVDSLHPTRSATAIFAALTGCELWLTSLGAGWMENWIVFHRLPEAIAGSRKLRAMLGPARAEKLGKALAQNAAGVGGSLTLGALLGMVPALGRFFGLPLESRHVTLMTGALALAACAMGPTHLGAAFLAAVAGIAVIALCNFGVSFSLALGVALRGREATREERLSVARALLGELRRRPLSFVLPPRR
jgi:site-specific recombinase